jgi:alpha-L-fucosidase
MGRWLKTYGTSVYATRGGPIAPRDWGVTTQRADTVFVHILNWPDRALSIPPITGRVVRAVRLGTNTPVEFAQSAAGVTLNVPIVADEIDRVVVLTLDKRKSQ